MPRQPNSNTVPAAPTAPVLAVRNLVVFPGVTVSVNVGRSQSVAALEKALEDDKTVILVAQKEDTGEINLTKLFGVGTRCRIEKVYGSNETGYQILLRGVELVRLHDYAEDANLITASVDTIDDHSDLDENTNKALVGSIQKLAAEILELVPGNTNQAKKLITGIDDLRLLIGLCVDSIEVDLEKKQTLLETDSLKQRALALLDLMQQFKEQLQIQHDISRKLSTKMSKRQRENILREQLTAIKEELDEDTTEAGYAERIKAAGMPEEVNKVALEELKKLEGTSTASPESQMIRNYLDLLCELPWKVGETPEIDLDLARRQLDEDHYGLDKIKERIIQHLAVMKLKGKTSGSVLILSGPPGVGKTSIAKSIATALGRKFIRASLGGVRDDAEVRGHRRTYIGSMPGKIIQSIRRAGVNNPVFLLDEIDKMGRSMMGDPGSALLEVLDPEQSDKFMDHYLDVPFDLSHVLFIATANTLESIPGPLLDRMEVIQVSGYTFAEKLHIAKNHLLKKQADELGIKPGQIAFTDEAMLRLVTHYTREAGVRNLQRQIATLMRASTEAILNAKEGQVVTVTIDTLEKVLGPEKYIQEVAQLIVPPGVVTGLAWTPVGGEILFIEAKMMAGSGKLLMTGQLGEVMKESAQIALSIVRSHLQDVVPETNFDRQDLHLHVPAGAIPKDGPSAGIAMLATIASLFTRKRVDPTIAMTGELTLRGAVMPVGGIKEKVLAAHRAGIKRVILAARNKADLREVPDEVKSEIEFTFVERAEEVLREVLGLEALDFYKSVDSSSKNSPVAVN